MMTEVSSSSSESEERGSAEAKVLPKAANRSPAEVVNRPAHTPSQHSTGTTPRQSAKEVVDSSDDERTPVVKDPTRTSGKRETISRKVMQREKKKRRSQVENSPNPVNLPLTTPVDSKPLKEEIKSEDVKPVKEEMGSRLSPEYLQELVELQHKIMTSSDRQKLQKVVDIIAEHSSFQLTQAHFNFDLCALDAQVVRQLQGCFS